MIDSMLEKVVTSPQNPSLDIDSRSSTPEERLKELSEKIEYLDKQVTKSDDVTKLSRISS